jgi:amino acid transporter
VPTAAARWRAPPDLETEAEPVVLSRVRGGIGRIGALGGIRSAAGSRDLPEGLGYLVKRRLLGPPLVNQQLGEQRLSNFLALGVLSPDGISSSAYGPEQILVALLLGGAGMAAFTLILPITLVTLVVLVLVVLSYREVVMVYIRPGGSYVVTRENFGPRVAQVTAVALMIDYVVTVGVQISGGTAAVVSAVPALGRYNTEITVGVILVMCYGNLRGIKEAGRSFAVPTYLFSGSVVLMIVVGVIREILGTLHTVNPHNLPDAYHVSAGTASLISVAMILTLLRSFANGGSSLTGIEAVSDAVGAFRPPEGVNARRVLAAEGSILGFLVAGIAWLAHVTHVTPRLPGFPTVLAQETQLVFGQSVIGHLLFYLVQAASALILYTGGNTSFNGFPFLASYVAGDSFLPRWLLKRGHRLVFSNAILVLTVASIALILARGANVTNLVPLYAIGVFTAFSMAGFGMARYHRRRRERGWRHKMVINTSAGVLTAIVVTVFAVVKFTEGAWIVVILFFIGVPTLIRLNREYRMESRVLDNIDSREKPATPAQPNYPRRSVLVFVDDFDLATIAALRYARSLRPTSLRAVHFVIDSVRADLLREKWLRADRGVVLDFVDCSDRRLVRAAAELVRAEAELPGVQVTVILPRRSFSPLLGRFLHDRTADKIAGAVSRIPHAAATIVPFDVHSRLETWQQRAAARAAASRAAGPAGQASARTQATVPAATRGSAAAGAGSGGAGRTAVAAEPAAAGGTAAPGSRFARPAPRPGVTAIGTLTGGDGSRGGGAPGRQGPPAGPGRATVEGRVFAMEIRQVERNTVLATEIADSTGQLTALFYGRSHIPGIACGTRVRFRGRVGIRDGAPVMINPAYELVAPDAPDTPSPPAGPGSGPDAPAGHGSGPDAPAGHG